ncbi:MAG: hypothetical protein MUP36_02255 [Demequinaceae bacterium]|nr:hypothetical protein [Demequinaceae bacterium]
MKIDCDTCAVRGDACANCVVSFLTLSTDERAPVDSSARGALVLDDEQGAAILAFSRGGLVPPLRHLAS